MVYCCSFETYNFPCSHIYFGTSKRYLNVYRTMTTNLYIAIGTQEYPWYHFLQPIGFNTGNYKVIETQLKLLKGLLKALLDFLFSWSANHHCHELYKSSTGGRSSWGSHQRGHHEFLDEMPTGVWIVSVTVLQTGTKYMSRVAFDSHGFLFRYCCCNPQLKRGSHSHNNSVGWVFNGSRIPLCDYLGSTVSRWKHMNNKHYGLAGFFYTLKDLSLRTKYTKQKQNMGIMLAMI